MGRLIALNQDYTLVYDFRDSSNSFPVRGIHVSGDTLYFSRTEENKIKLTHFLDDKFQLHKCDAELRKQPQYIDKTFRIGTCCMANGKGSIFFTSTGNGETFAAPASCIVGVNTLNEVYYVTSITENDNGWRSTVVEIVDPGKLYKLNRSTSPAYPDAEYYYCNWWREVIEKEGEELLRKGCRTVHELNNILIPGSFVVDKKLYHLCCSENKTFIGMSARDSLFECDSLLGKSIYEGVNSDELIQPMTCCFSLPELAGFIRVKEDSVHVVRFIHKPRGRR